MEVTLPHRHSQQQGGQQGVHLNISVPERKLSFTQVACLSHIVMSWSCYDNILSQVGEVRASVMDTVMDHMMDLDTLDTGEEADNGDDMDEMNMPNPGKPGVLNIYFI